MNESKKFEDFLTDDDYGFIVDSKTGKLKGLWVPDGHDDTLVPESIVKICKEYFDIDPNQEDDEVTLH